jgi:AraC-like DNA-binding protein
MPDAPHIFSAALRVEPGDNAAFEGWRLAVAPMFEMDAYPPQSRKNFFVDCTTHQFTDATVTTAVSAPCRFDRNHRTISQGGLDNICVLTYLEGGFTLTANGTARTVESCDVCLLDLTQTCMLVTTAYRHISFVMPRAAMTEFLPDVESLHGVVIGKNAPLSSLLVSHLRALHVQAPQFSVAEARAAVRGTAALVMACAGALRRPHANTRQVAAASLQAMRQVIEASLGDSMLDANFLMRRFGISRATLYRQFAPLGGVRGYIHQRRMIRAYQAIADTANRQERIGVISRRYGFSSETGFSRAFRAQYGVSPSHMRTLMAKGEPPPSATGPGDFVRINRWLLGLDNQGR